MSNTKQRRIRRTTSEVAAKTTPEPLRPIGYLEQVRIVAEDEEDPVFRTTMDAGLARAKAAAKAKRKSRIRNPLATWLRKKLSRLNYGKKYPGTKPTPKMSAEELVKMYRKKRCGASINNEQYQRHFDLLDTLYFWADHRTATPEILVMIDIDVHDGVGTKDGAWRFAELVEVLFPGIHLEPSTNGEGVHGYVVVSKAGIGVKEVKYALRNLQAYLQELHRFVGADISCVEVKGGPPDVKYDDLTGDIIEIVFGQLAKIPRQTAVMDTCVVEYKELAFLDAADIPVKFRRFAARSTSPASGAAGTTLAPAAAGSIPAPAAAGSTALPAAAARKRIGSHDTRIIRQDVLDALPDLEKYAARLLRQWTGESALKADRWAVTPLDLAQFFAVMLALSRDDDGFAARCKASITEALPVRQIGNLWQAAYKDGDFARPFNHHRFTKMRDLLSEHGHIDWIEHRYFNFPEPTGKRKRDGWCCKWRLGEMLQGALLSLIHAPPHFCGHYSNAARWSA